MSRVRKVSSPSTGAVRNATKVTYDGIKFDSKLEQFVYAQLKLNKINFALKYKVVIFEKFRYNDELIREISWTPDFILPDHNIVLEAKGYANDQWSLKIKLIKKYFLQELDFVCVLNGGLFYEGKLKSPKIQICKSQKEVLAFVSSLKG
jgi:hypothetical protein